jgi:L-ascorbate metabolism protein UlaG (beta-lactamase superfamily)
MTKSYTFKISAGITSGLFFGWLGLSLLKAELPEVSFTSNPDLPYLMVPANWKGTPILSDGTFQNIDHPFESSFHDLLKWKLSKNPQAEAKKSDIQKLEIEPNRELSNLGKNQLIWLGHASYLIQLEGVTILTDPVWIDNWVLKRNSQLPLDPSQLEKLDYILISHDHRDHCDKNTLKLLGKMFPAAQVLTGLNMKPLIQDWIPKAKIQEAGWYQNFQLSEPLKITFVPSRHWSRRGLLDQNERLWGGFFIQTNSKSIYFMGDSGYGPHFKQIAETLGSPDYALMGVGAYKPEWFMQQAHTSPSEAAKAFLEMNSKYFIPMHFGTFDLSDEPLLDPLNWLIANPKATNDQMILPILGKNLFVN